MLKLLYPPPKTYSAMECVSVRCQTDYLSSKITVLRAWSARREVQPQREGKEHPACQRNSVFLTFFYQFYKHPLSTVRLRDGSLSYRLLLEAQTVPGSRTVQHARSTVFSTAKKKGALAVLKCVSIFFYADADEVVLKSLGQGCAHCTLVISCQGASPNL